MTIVNSVVILSVTVLQDGGGMVDNSINTTDINNNKYAAGAQRSSRGAGIAHHYTHTCIRPFGTFVGTIIVCRPCILFAMCVLTACNCRTTASACGA